MNNQRILTAVLAAIAVCLVKLAFFPHSSPGDMLVRPAAAQGSIIEWQGSKRIVTSSTDGTITYIWDYDSQTQVRKYSIINGELQLETYKLGK